MQCQRRNPQPLSLNSLSKKQLGMFQSWHPLIPFANSPEMLADLSTSHTASLIPFIVPIWRSERNHEVWTKKRFIGLYDTFSFPKSWSGRFSFWNPIEEFHIFRTGRNFWNRMTYRGPDWRSDAPEFQKSKGRTTRAWGPHSAELRTNLPPGWFWTSNWIGEEVGGGFKSGYWIRKWWFGWIYR